MRFPASSAAARSRARKPDSPSRWKISGMEQPAVVSIIWSRSTASRPVRRESASPTVVLPLPGMPIRMRLVISRRS